MEKKHYYWTGEAKIIDTEKDRIKRFIEHAIAIWTKDDTSRNRDGGYFLPYIFDNCIVVKYPRSIGNSQNGN